MKICKIPAIFFLLAMAVLFSSSMKAGDKVPDAVRQAFEQKYPGVEKVKWDQQNGQCIASFKWNDKKCIATFSESGEWLQSETMLKYTELPLDLKKKINVKYTAGSIKEASKMEQPAAISYRIYLKPGWSPEWIQFAEDGTVIQ
jgi:hypothetical protein